MLSNGTLTAVLVALVAASHAVKTLQKVVEEEEEQQEEEEEDSRLFSSAGGQNFTVTLGSATIFLIGTAMVALLVAVAVIFGVLVFGGWEEEASGYESTSSYASDPIYGETYAVHRSLEEAAKKYS